MPFAFVWWRYPYEINAKGEFVAPLRSRPSLLARFHGLHIALANVRTSEQALEFVRTYGIPKVSEIRTGRGDLLLSGYTVSALIREAARMRIALAVADLLRLPCHTETDQGTIRKKLIDLTSDKVFRGALSRDRYVARAQRAFKAKTVQHRGNEQLFSDEKILLDHWQNAAQHRGADQWGKNFAAVSDLIHVLMRRALSGHRPRLEATLETRLGGESFIVWVPTTLLDLCWLNLLQAIATTRLPKLCPCGDFWHDERGIYHSQECKNRQKAKRHYWRGRARRGAAQKARATKAG